MEHRTDEGGRPSVKTSVLHSNTPKHWCIYTVSQKNCAFLFVSELRQISTNINEFW